MPAIKYTRLILGSLSVVMLSACMSSESGYSEQQKRMLRCDQYVGETRDECLRGVAVTVEDYKDDYREFERTEQKKKEAQNKILKKEKPKTEEDPPTT